MPAITPILFIDNTCTFGGAINSLQNLLKAIDRRRFQPVLVTGQRHEVLQELPNMIKYHLMPRFPWVDNRMYNRIARLPLFRCKTAIRMLNILRFLFWLLRVYLPEAVHYYRIGRRHHVALVHLNNIIGTQLSGIIAAKLLGVPCIAHMRDFEDVKPLTRFLAKWVDHYVAISQATRDNIRQLGVSPDRITLVHDAIDLEEFNLQASVPSIFEEFHMLPGQPAFGIFGRVVAWKGIREFILAARQVIHDHPEAKAFVVGGPSGGDDEFFHSMQQLAADCGLAGKVIFTGYRRDVFALMGQMDTVVHASNRPEPFGMVIIEGMAMKKPIVATRGGGPLDIVIDHQTGLLVEMGCPDELARAISFLLHRPDLRTEMGQAGYSLVKALFSSYRSARRMETVYHNLGEICR